MERTEYDGFEMSDSLSDSLRERLFGFIKTKIRESGKPVPPDFDEDTPVISSGLLESLHLLELALLLEEEIGSPLDLAALNIDKEWDSINAISNFVERYRS